jgi:hypothetical protein
MSIGLDPNDHPVTAVAHSISDQVAKNLADPGSVTIGGSVTDNFTPGRHHRPERHQCILNLPVQFDWLGYDGQIALIHPG